MPNETKKLELSKSKTSEVEKKDEKPTLGQHPRPVQPPPQAQRPPTPQQPQVKQPPTPQAQPKPATPVIPGPQARPAVAQPVKPQILGTPRKGRRSFLKALLAAGGALSLLPYLPMGSFLLPIGGQPLGERQKIVLADGTVPNVKTFPVNSRVVFVYPRTGDAGLDSEPFRRFQLIRLPKEFRGDVNDASAFRAYSMICVHLWCLWDYKPQRRREECPCHGSIYDPCSGLAIAGPASLQTPPNNALPKLDLAVEGDGSVSVLSPTWSVNANGLIGFGRRVQEKECL